MKFTEEPEYVSLERKVTTGKHIIRDEKGDYICEARGPHVPVLVAAPEMLETLKEAVETMRPRHTDECMRTGNMFTCNCWVQRARDLIYRVETPPVGLSS